MEIRDELVIQTVSEQLQKLLVSIYFSTIKIYFLVVH